MRTWYTVKVGVCPGTVRIRVEKLKYRRHIQQHLLQGVPDGDKSDATLETYRNMYKINVLSTIRTAPLSSQTRCSGLDGSMILVIAILYSCFLTCACIRPGTTPRCTTGSVLELLDANDLELRLLSMATLTNILSFSDTLLLSREECIDAVNDRFHIVVDAIKRCDRFF